MLAIFDKEVRRECERMRMRRQVLPQLVRYTPVVEGYGESFISWSDLIAGNADAVIQSQIDYFRKLNNDFEWIYYSYDLPMDLPQRLLNYGFAAKEPVALMVADMSDMPGEYWTRDVSFVQRITTPQGVDEVMRMQHEVWGDDFSELARDMNIDLEHNATNLSVFAVRQDGRVVSAAWTSFLSPTSFATLSGGSTLKAYRHRGFYTALLVARAREANQRRFRFLQVYASPDSQPILANHGFRCLAYATAYQWKPNGTRGRVHNL